MTSTVASTSRIMVGRLRSDLSGRDVAPDHVASMRARLTPLVDHPLCLGGDQIVQRVATDGPEAVRGEEPLDLFARSSTQERKLVADRRVLLARARAASRQRQDAWVELAVHDDEASAGTQHTDPLVDRGFRVRERPEQVAADHEVEAGGPPVPVRGDLLLDDVRWAGLAGGAHGFTPSRSLRSALHPAPPGSRRAGHCWAEALPGCGRPWPGTGPGYPNSRRCRPQCARGRNAARGAACR